MKKFIFSFLLCFGLLEVHGQVNLVPNPSFEEYSQCPDPTILNPVPNTTLELATGWISPNAYSPDYFNSCSANNYGAPSNDFGFQNPRTGEGYAGLITMIETDSREYIQSELLSYLQSGKKYLVKFFVSASENSPYISNDIGAYFSNEPILSSSLHVFSYIPQISNNSQTNPLTDTGNWVEVSGYFTSNGGEKYITIGNFNNDINTDTTHLNQGWNALSYNFIDDVSVVCTDCDLGKVNFLEIENQISLYPNPVSNYLIIDSENLDIYSIVILNSQGTELIRYDNNTQNIIIEVSIFDSGLYYVKMKTEKGYITKKIIINK